MASQCTPTTNDGIQRDARGPDRTVVRKVPKTSTVPPGKCRACVLQVAREKRTGIAAAVAPRLQMHTPGKASWPCSSIYHYTATCWLRCACRLKNTTSQRMPRWCDAFSRGPVCLYIYILVTRTKWADCHDSLPHQCSCHKATGGTVTPIAALFAVVQNVPCRWADVADENLHNAKIKQGGAPIGVPFTCVQQAEKHKSFSSHSNLGWGRQDVRCDGQQRTNITGDSDLRMQQHSAVARSASSRPLCTRATAVLAALALAYGHICPQIALGLRL